MRIIHFSLGFPPFRTGGLVRYVCDLALYQAESQGFQVTVLHPGRSRLIGGPSLVYRPSRGPIRVVEIQNPSPIPLLMGISDPWRIHRPRHSLSRVLLDDFLEREQPNIIHIHTWMGFPDGLLESAQARGVKIIFTAHDYYGICLKTNLIDSTDQPCNGPEATKCATCNKNAPGPLTRFVHSQAWLHNYKSELRKLSRFFPKRNEPRKVDQRPPPSNLYVEFDVLISKYFHWLNMVDHFHFASTVSESVYKNHLPGLTGEIIPISHQGILDLRLRKVSNTGPLRLGYVGGNAPYKGLPLLLEMLDAFRRKGLDGWTLQVFGPGHENAKKQTGVYYQGAFPQGETHHRLQNLDLLLVPSIWKETFSLVALEALASGVPVLVSPTVGAKNILESDFPYLIATSMDDYVARLEALLGDPDRVREIGQRLKHASLPLDSNQHYANIADVYHKLASQS